MTEIDILPLVWEAHISRGSATSKSQGAGPSVPKMFGTLPTHIDNIITSCARVLYGLRTLRSHGTPPDPALHAVFQSTALAKVTYASPAW